MPVDGKLSENNIATGDNKALMQRLLQHVGAVQVVKMPLDFVFFRVRPGGSIAETDQLLPGYDLAKREIAVRMWQVKTGKVTVPAPEEETKTKHTWKAGKGGVAGKMRQHIEKLKQSLRRVHALLCISLSSCIHEVMHTHSLVQ
jgi:hypothetical protein